VAESSAAFIDSQISVSRRTQFGKLRHKSATAVSTMVDYPTSSVPLTNIVEPSKNDVLSGRGVTTNRFPGNMSYRSLVALNKVSV
jgi:hypothetical protein